MKKKTSCPSDEKEKRYNTLYMDIAERIALMSYARRRKVGAIAVRDGNILGFGFNGTPSGYDNNCEDEEFKTKPEVLHAEENLVSKLARGTNGLLGSDVYVTTAPCLGCAKLLSQAGVRKVFYLEDYKNQDGLKLLNNLNIGVEKL